MTLTSPSPYRPGYGVRAVEAPQAPSPLIPKAPERIDVYEFLVVVIDGQTVQGVIRRRVRERETITIRAHNPNHARAKLMTRLHKDYPYIRDDHSLVYVNGITQPRTALGQRRYFAVAGSLTLGS